MSRFRVLAVDDEPLAREVLRDLLARDPEVELVGECGDGESALDAIRARRPDVVFLDVEMPERGGLEVAAALAPEELPAIVFVTAYGHHAVDAFELAALDYVVKPFSDQRFYAALERAKRRVRERRLGELAGKMAMLGAELGAPDERVEAERGGDYLTRIPVRCGDREEIVRVEDLRYLESCDYYARLHTVRGTTHLVRESLASFEQKLDPGRFLRIHRRAIVNLERVVRVEGRGRALVVEGDVKLPISRSRRRRVREALAFKRR